MRAVLLRCKLRESTFVPVKGAEPITLPWEDLLELLTAHTPPGSEERRLTARMIRSAKVGDFLGLVRPRGDLPDSPRRRLFLYGAAGHDGDIAPILRDDETFPTRLLACYRVEKVELDVTRSESGAVEGELQVAAAPTDHMVPSSTAGG